MNKRRKCKVGCLILTIMLIMMPLQTQAASKAYANGCYNRSYSLNGTQQDNLVAVAEKQIGKKMRSFYREAWCADFVSDCAKLAGLSDIIPFNASCYYLYKAVMRADGKVVSSPQKGDLVFYICSKCTSTAYKWCHVGIMTDSVHSIEGNSNNKVKKVSGSYSHYNGGTHSIRNGKVYRKFVRPAYANQQSPVYNGVNYSSVYNFDYYILKNPDVKRKYGDDQKAVFEHFLARGMLEGRRGSVGFDVNYYRSQNPDLQRAYGDDLKAYYFHYITRGRLENRKGVETNVNGVDYSWVYNFDYYTMNNPDVKRKYGDDRDKTFQHFLGRGMLEGRRGSAEFDVNYYRDQNSDLERAYGDDLQAYYFHYITQGRLENRKGAYGA